jgi:hypothetical protein
MIAAHPEVILSIKKKLTARFKMHDLGPIRYYLGMLVVRDCGSKVLYLSQPSYVDAILEHFGMKECKMLSTPMDGRVHKKKEEELAADKQEYQILLGSLMYLSTATRPDLAYALGRLSRFAREPSIIHAAAVKRVLRYVAGTPDPYLCLGGEDAELVCYVDAYYADDSDDFHSTSGMLMTFGGAFDWRSRKQKSTAQSTTDAEYYAFGSGCMRLAQLNHLFTKMRIPDLAKPSVLYDNKGYLKSIKHGKYCGTTVAYIATKYQLAIEMLS